MSFSQEQIAALTAKLDPSHVRPPQQYGPKGDYLEGWHVIAEANRIFGFDAWSYEVVEARCVSEAARKIGRQQKDGWGVTYTAKVRAMVQDVIREDFGAGHGYDVDAGLAHESAVKEAVTDALKRALRTFGNPFGLALYDKTRANVGTDNTQPDTDDRTRDQRSEQGRRQVEAGKRTSSAAQKRGLADIEKELLDCHSLIAVGKCADAWKFIAKRDGWSKDFLQEAANRFQRRRAEIESAEQKDAA
jgi:DNA recombination protein Rad52